MSVDIEGLVAGGNMSQDNLSIGPARYMLSERLVSDVSQIFADYHHKGIIHIPIELALGVFIVDILHHLVLRLNPIRKPRGQSGG